MGRTAHRRGCRRRGLRSAFSRSRSRLHLREPVSLPHSRARYAPASHTAANTSGERLLRTSDRHSSPRLLGPHHRARRTPRPSGFSVPTSATIMDGRIEASGCNRRTADGTWPRDDRPVGRRSPRYRSWAVSTISTVSDLSARGRPRTRLLPDQRMGFLRHTVRILNVITRRGDLF